jgi:hypothetical protein
MTDAVLPQYNKEHYDFLMMCSRKRDFTDWNTWHKEYRKYNSGGAQLGKAELSGIYLNGADMRLAHLEEADLSRASLAGANFGGAHLERADIRLAHLEEADLNRAHLAGVNFGGAHLEGAELFGAHLAGAALTQANLQGANFSGAHLAGADFYGSHLERARFFDAQIDGATHFTGCMFDSNTDFTATAIAVSRIEPDTLTRLQYNIRRKYWEKRYVRPVIYPLHAAVRRLFTGNDDGYDYPRSEYGTGEGRIWKYGKMLFIDLPTEAFWWVSDYGTNTIRIILAFFSINVLFGLLYYVFLPPVNQTLGVAENIFDMTGTTLPMALIQSNMIVFSVTDVATRNLHELTMLIVMIHIVLGYVLLAALVTRLGIMYQSLSP